MPAPRSSKLEGSAFGSEEEDVTVIVSVKLSFITAPPVGEAIGAEDEPGGRSRRQCRVANRPGKDQLVGAIHVANDHAAALRGVPKRNRKRSFSRPVDSAKGLDRLEVLAIRKAKRSKC